MNESEPDSRHAVREIRTGSAGRYVLATVAGDSLLTYRLDGNLMIIDYTFTPPPLRGQGMAGVLVERAVVDARTRGWRVIPQCPYVKMKIDRTPSLQDVLGDGRPG